MEFKIIPKTDIIPSFKHNTIVVKNIECASYGEQYDEDENIYTPIDYDGQSPIPKCQTITDMNAGVKAVEYFIRTRF